MNDSLTPTKQISFEVEEFRHFCVISLHRKYLSRFASKNPPMITRFCVFHVKNNVEARIRGFRRRKKVVYVSHESCRSTRRRDANQSNVRVFFFCGLRNWVVHFGRAAN